MFAKGVEWNQVRYTNVDREQKWKLPHLWNSFYVNSSLGEIHFVGIDTHGLRVGQNDPDQQLADVGNALQTSRGRMKIVFGHHPPYTVGGHAPGSSTIRNRVHVCLNNICHNVVCKWNRVSYPFYRCQ